MLFKRTSAAMAPLVLSTPPATGKGRWCQLHRQHEMKMGRLATILVSASVCWSLASPAEASLTLTPAGIADGFTLSTFVSGYSAQYGPLAQGILPNGNVLTGSLINTPNVGPPTIFVFPDVDGQTLATA